MKTLQINYLAVIVSAIVVFMLGAAWYIGFSKPWMQYSGVTEEMSVKAGGSSYIVSFITYLLASYAMAVIFKSMGVKTVSTGAMTGALIGALIVGGNIFTNNAYELKPINLSILNAGFSAISFAVAGGILGGWTKYK